MYVILGASGNTGKRISETLLAAGKAVTVVSRKAENIADLVAKGAVAAIGDSMDADFLAATFKGATAVYSLVPPNFAVTHWRTYQTQAAFALASAVRESGVKYVVNLSSVGAHMPEGAGPVSGSFYLEKMLDAVKGLNVLHLRPAYFYENFYAFMGMMKHAGIFGNSVNPNQKVPMVHTRDIAEVAAKRLLALDFEGVGNIQDICGAADFTFPEAVKIIGEGIGQPALVFVPFTPQQEYDGMVQAGVPPTIAEGYNALAQSINGGEYYRGYVRTPENTTSSTLEDFVRNEFVHAYNA